MDAERGRGLAHDPADDFAADGEPGAGRGGDSSISGRTARRSARRHDRPATTLAVHTNMDGGSGGGAGPADTAERDQSVGAARIHVSDGDWRGDERSGMAGDHARGRISAAARVSSRPEFGRIQRRARRRAGAGRNGGGSGGIGMVLPAERGIVFRRHLVFVQVAAGVAGFVADAPVTRSNPGRLSLRAGRTRGKVGTHSHGSIQRGRYFFVGPSARRLPAARSARLWISIDLLWCRCPCRSGSLASAPTEIFGGWISGRSDRRLRRNDVSCRASAYL